MTNTDIIKRLWCNYMRSYLWHYAGTIASLMLLASTNAVIINQVPAIIDEILTDENHELAYWIAGVIIITLLIRGIATFTQALLMNSVALKIIRRLQNQMFEILTEVDMLYLQKHGTAAQISRFTNDVGVLSAATGRLITSFGKDFIVLIAMIGTMFYHNAKVAMAVVIIVPLLLVPVMYLAKKVRALSTDIQQRLSKTTAILDDSLKSAMQVRAYNMQKQEQQRVGLLFQKVYSLSLKSVVFQNAVYPFVDIIGGFIFAGVLLWGSVIVANAEMTAGSFLTFFIAMFAAYTPLRSLSGLYAALQNGMAAAVRIFTLLDYESEMKLDKKAPKLKISDAEISFNNVSFSYEEDSPKILHDINVTFAGSKQTALIGYSGSGKTSLLQLIPRFFDCDNGSITIDGQDIKNLDAESLRQNIAMVFQNAPLFNISIADNIRLGKDVSKARLQEVCKQALLEDFISDLPDGLDTHVGELGGLVSGGQRQRIAIARAILKDAPILLLDEATSALDQAHESEINKILQELMQNRTVVVIAHKLSTVRNCDKIYLLKDGKILGSGRHDELIKNSDYYKKLCDTDFNQ